MDTVRLSIAALPLSFASASAQTDEPPADEDDSPSIGTPYPHKLVPLGDGVFLIVREDGLTKTCAVRSGDTSHRCGPWQRLPR